MYNLTTNLNLGRHIDWSKRSSMTMIDRSIYIGSLLQLAFAMGPLEFPWGLLYM